MHERRRNTFDAVYECSRVFPVSELDGAARGFDASTRHDHHEEYDGDEGKTLEEGEPEFNFTVKLDWPVVDEGDDEEEDRDPYRYTDLVRTFPIVQDGNAGSDLYPGQQLLPTTGLAAVLLRQG